MHMQTQSIWRTHEFCNFLLLGSRKYENTWFLINIWPNQQTRWQNIIKMLLCLRLFVRKRSKRNEKFLCFSSETMIDFFPTHVFFFFAQFLWTERENSVIVEYSYVFLSVFSLNQRTHNVAAPAALLPAFEHAELNHALDLDGSGERAFAKQLAWSLVLLRLLDIIPSWTSKHVIF
jgi:hypothetical protein